MRHTTPTHNPSAGGHSATEHASGVRLPFLTGRAIRTSVSSPGVAEPKASFRLGSRILGKKLPRIRCHRYAPLSMLRYGPVATSCRAVRRMRLTRVARSYQTLPLVAVVVLLAFAPSRSFAIIPVTDVGAILQLITQVHTMENQLLTARDQLTQAQSTLTAMTGARGMQNLLSGTARNYLPTDYQQLIDVMHSASASYSTLSRQIQAIRNANAILSNAELARLTPVQRLMVEDARREAATLDALTRGALNTTSGRFAAIQQLITAIGTAHDQKAILDLQARIQAEQGMLQNESTKLDVLYHTATASQQERAQRIREQAIADVGSLRALPPMGLSLHP